jgi:hypothetical protein
MQPGVTLDDGVRRSFWIGDRARRARRRLRPRDAVRPAVVAAFPRGAFDRHFADAIRREAARRPTCQSARALPSSRPGRLNGPDRPGPNATRRLTGPRRR